MVTKEQALYFILSGASVSNKNTPASATMKNPLKHGYLEDGPGGVDQLVAGCGWNLQPPQIFKLKYKKNH